MIIDGDVQVSQDLPSDLCKAIDELDSSFKSLVPCVATVTGGPFHGLTALGFGSNWQVRERSAFLAMTVSVKLIDVEAQTNATLDDDFQVLLREARELPAVVANIAQVTAEGMKLLRVKRAADAAHTVTDRGTATGRGAADEAKTAIGRVT